MSTKSRLASDVLREALGHVSFGQMIHAYRGSLELNQTDFANKLKISKQDLCNIEKGRKAVSVERAVAFAKALKMSPKVFATYALQDQLHKAGIPGEIIIKDVA